jgi:2-succinyl-5-enolpyruvyl-6-hydroxy-3-cyclohexene-1-carboxylate synthase
MVINNGKGAEFKIYSHQAYQWGQDSDKYIAAAGHFGNKSINLIKNYAEALGYEYLTADTKEEYLKTMERFITPELTERPMVFEVFTESEKESEAIYIMNHLAEMTSMKVKVAVKEIAKDAIEGIAGDKGVNTVKKIFGKK